MPTSYINDAKHWSDRAEEMRTFADHMKDEQSRDRVLRIAADYERMARDALQRAAPPQQPK